MAKYVFYGKTLHSLKWQPETNECVSATDSVKMRVRILTSCKNRVKTSYKQEEGRKRLKDKESKSQRDNVIKRKRGKDKPRKPLEEYGGCAAAVMLPFWSYKSKLLTPNRQHPPCLLSEGCHSLQGDKQK